MTAPTIYRSDDPGAPVISDSRDGLYQILKACLIDGYGSKAAAGWSVVYDAWVSDGVFSLTNALQTGVLGLKWLDNVSYGPGFFVCEGMIDAVTPVNARSGKNALSSLDDLTDVAGWQRATFSANVGSIHTQWVVIANDNTALFFMGNDNVLFSPHITLTGNSYLQFCGFGAAQNAAGLADGDVGNFHIIGGNHKFAFSGSPVYGWGGDFNNNFRGTVFYEAGAVKTGLGHMVSYPLGSYHPGADYVSSGTAYLPLAPVLFRDKSAGEDIAVFPMLLTAVTLVTYTDGNILDTVQRHFDVSKTALGDTVSIAGKNLTLCSLGWYQFGFVSLDAADWL